MEPLNNVVVVLVSTTHPGNIGASARAMKTMGLRRLRLVEPSRFPSAVATERATGADDVLNDAEILGSLDEALADTAWAVGTSARGRRLDWPLLDPAACAKTILNRAARGRPVALVFGREQSGLTNNELDKCQALVRIPTVPDYSSLNLAAAVQLLAYELQKAVLAAESIANTSRRELLATPAELEGFYGHLEKSLTTIGYYDAGKPRLLLRRLRRLFARAELERSELKILRGILAAAEKTAKQNLDQGSR